MKSEKIKIGDINFNTNKDSLILNLLTIQLLSLVKMIINLL